MTAEKCCFCIKLETGCLLLGITTLVVSLAMISVTIGVIIAKDAEKPPELKAAPNVTISVHNNTRKMLDVMVSNKSLKTVIVGFIMIVCFLWMIKSFLLIVCIVKKKPNFLIVMSYFLYGIALSIMLLLTALLEVISGYWIPSIVTFILTLGYIKNLTSVYAYYDQIRQLKATGDMEQLITDDEPWTECQT